MLIISRARGVWSTAYPCAGLTEVENEQQLRFSVHRQPRHCPVHEPLDDRHCRHQNPAALQTKVQKLQILQKNGTKNNAVHVDANVQHFFPEILI